MMKRASLRIGGNALMRSFDKKGEVMIGILGSMNETLSGVKGDTSKMLEKQDMMLEKQDETIDAIDRSKEEIVTEISSLREDLRSHIFSPAFTLKV